MSRHRRILLYSGLALLVLVAGVAVSAIVVFRSAWFHDAVRSRIVGEVERATGGRAEIGAFQFDWPTLTATVRPFVLHGKERPAEPPLVRADSVQVGLKVVSALRRDVDIASLIIEHPSVDLIVYPDGTTNVPSPKLPGSKDPVQRLIDLAVGRFEARGGVLEFRNEKTPFDIRADDIRAVFDFDRSGPMYKGHLASKQVRLNSSAAGPVAMNLDADVRLLKDRIEVADARFRTEKSTMDASGGLTDILQPRGEFNVRASLSLAEFGKPLRLPIEHRGTADFDGKVRFAVAPKFDYSIQGRVNAKDLAVRNRGVEISGIGLRCAMDLTPSGVRATQVKAAAMGGSFSGAAELRNFRELLITGEGAGLSLSQLGSIVARDRPSLGYSGTVSGPVHVTGTIADGGVRNVQARVEAHIAPAPGPIPVEGLVDLNYSGQERQIQLGQSWISTPHSRVDVSGTLGQTLAVFVRSSDLSDVKPALDFVGAGAREMPLELRNGKLTANVTVAGPLDNPRITGKASASNFIAQGHEVESASGDLDATAATLHADRVTVDLDGMRMTGSGQIGLVNWRPVETSRIAGLINVSGVDLRRISEQAGHKDLPISGTASASLNVSGQYGSPATSGRLHLDHPAGFGEQFDSADADLTLSGDNLTIKSGQLRMGKSKVDFGGTYSHQRHDWATGGLAFDASTASIPIATVEAVRQLHPGLTGDVAFRATGTARVVNGAFDLESLQSRAELRAVSVDGTRFGNVQLTAETHGETLEFTLGGNVRESKIEGSGQWKLAGDDPGHGEVRFSSIRIATLKRLVSSATGTQQDLPFEGSVEGKVDITGPLKKPGELAVTVTLPRVEILPQPEQRLRAGARAQDLSLRNIKPVVVRGTATQLNVESAQFAAKDTNLQVAGTVGLNEKALWNLDVRGGINLAILQLFNPDLVAQGSAVVNATIKGALRDPQLNGKLELKSASLYLGDIPVGVDNANGMVLFDRNRATIQRLTAEVGGGQIALAGFVGFGGGSLVYHVQATANQVRIRYPEGVSLTANAALNLGGTSANSVVSGTVTVIRAAFTPRADVAGMLAQFSGPSVAVPETPSDYLRNIQFDVRIESGPSLEVSTSLARNIEAEAEVRLRGTAARPVLLGDVSVTEGEIELFGSKYEVNRGDIRFMNPTRIEPYFDVDLQTKARGIEVTISFTGTLNKLNMTYRSDPPLQPNEIIALLAMGRDPTTYAGLASAQVSSQSLLQTGTGALEQVISSPVSGRLQRFFGVSRLKIDPQLTGVNTLPEARLTMEQAISRDITLTYITNLARTNEQLVQIQWDINRKWSAIATREENGVFGIDFQYRKRFK